MTYKLGLNGQKSWGFSCTATHFVTRFPTFPYPISDLTIKNPPFWSQNGKNLYPDKQANHTQFSSGTYIYSLYRGVSPPTPGTKGWSCHPSFWANLINVVVVVVVVLSFHFSRLFCCFCCCCCCCRCRWRCFCCCFCQLLMTNQSYVEVHVQFNGMAVDWGNPLSYLTKKTGKPVQIWQNIYLIHTNTTKRTTHTPSTITQNMQQNKDTRYTTLITFFFVRTEVCTIFKIFSWVLS